MIRSFIGLVHTIAACCALLSGLIVFSQPKATPLHRSIGYVYVCSMVLLIVTAFFTYHLTGSFNILHVAAIVSCPPLVLGMTAVITKRPESEWLTNHYRWMSWSYVGLCSAFVAEMSTRIVMPYVYRHSHLRSMLWFWLVVASASSLVTAGGAYLVKRNRQMIARFQGKRFEGCVKMTGAEDLP